MTAEIRVTPMPTADTTWGDIHLNIAAFRRHLVAENKSPQTIKAYITAGNQLAAFLAEKNMPLDVAGISREHVESYITAMLARWKPNTAANRFRGLQAFWKWLKLEGEIPESPMVNMKQPTIPEELAAMPSDDDVSAMLKVCERGKDFEDRRDAAILRLFVSTGARLAEITNISLQDDVDVERGRITLLGKGRRSRAVALTGKAAKAFDRYVLRARRRHPQADSPALWLGKNGPLTASGIAQIVERRGDQAGVGRVHPHMFRHFHAHTWLSRGGSETDLMYNLGWKSREILQRYGASAAGDRAIAASQRLAIGDDL